LNFPEENGHASRMSKIDEKVLVVRRSLFDELGSFQGFCADAPRYLDVFLRRENNFFSPRSTAETDPSLKQIIPYAVFTHGGRILRYVRGGKSGEKRLVAKASIGIGGHINDGDEGLFAFNQDTYRNAVDREITEELRFPGSFTDRAVGLINDDSNEVGQVHLGVVHLVELESDDVKAGEAAITQIEFLTPEAIREQRDNLETWSQIVLDHWDEIRA
jgi:predicted NUDIX family phosphoesterase